MSEYTLLDIKRPQRTEPDFSEMTLLGINMPSEPVEEEKSGVITELGRGLVEGVAGMGETAGTLMKIVSGDKGKAGPWLEEKSKALGDKFRMPEDLQERVVDRPGLLLEPRWLAHSTGQLLGSMAAPIGVGGTAAKGANVLFKKIMTDPRNISRATKYAGLGAGGATGGAMEGTQTYNSVLEETGDKNKALKAGSLMALGSAALNSLSFGKMLSQKTKSKIAHVIASGVTEGATEQAEEPWDAIVSGHPEKAVDAWIDGFNVFFPSLIVGGLGGAGGAQLSKDAPAKNTLTNDEMVEVKNAIKETAQEKDLSPEEKEYVDWWLSEIEKAEAEKGPMEQWASTTPQWTGEKDREHLEAQQDLGQGKLRDRLAMEEETYGRDYPALPKPDVMYQEGEAEPQRMIGQRKVPMIENKTLALPKPEAIHLPDQSVLNLPDMSVSEIIAKKGEILESSDMTPDDLNQLIIDKQSRKFETGQIETDPMQSEADRLGVVYNGVQEGLKEPLHLFTDNENGSTFAVKPGGSVEDALKGNRERFATSAKNTQADPYKETESVLNEKGFSVTGRPPKSDNGEAYLYKQGYRPYLLKDGELVEHPLGIWAKETSPKTPITEAPLASVQGEVMEAKGEAPVKGKEPSGMSRKEFADAHTVTKTPYGKWKVQFPGTKGKMDSMEIPIDKTDNPVDFVMSKYDYHKDYIKKAISEGKIDSHPDYPDLTPQSSGKAEQSFTKTEQPETVNISTIPMEAKEPSPSQQKTKPGYVWVKEKQRPFTTYREILRGKNKGMYRVTVGGKGYLVDRGKIARFPEEALDKEISKANIAVDEQRAVTRKSLKKDHPDWSAQRIEDELAKTVRAGEEAGVSEADERTGKPAVKRSLFEKKAVGAETAPSTAKHEPVSQKPKPVTESRQKKTPDLTATFPSSYSKTPREVLGKNSLWKVVSKDGKVVETEYATHPHILIVMDKKDRDAIGYQGKTPKGRDAVVSKEVVDSQLKSFKKRGTEVKTIEIAKYAERDDRGILSDGNIEVAVNPNLIGMVKRQHPNATFYLNGPERPIAAFDGKEWKALIMPVRGADFESFRKDAETIIEVPASAKVGKASSPPRPQGATVPKKQNVITGTIREKVDEAIKKAPEIDSDDLLRLDEIRDFKPSKWESDDAGKKRGAEDREFYDSLKKKYGTIEITSPTGQGWKYNIINTKHHLGNFKKQIEKLEKGKEGIALFRKGKPSGIPIPTIKTALEPITAKWKGAPKIVVTNTKDTKIPKGLMRQMGDAEGVAGAFYEDTVYLFNDNIDSIDDAQKTILHESAHWGPRRMFGRSFDRFLRGVLRSADKGVLDRVAKLYECDMTKVPDRMLAAEEYVAHISETGQDAKTWNRFTSYVKQWLIKRGFTVKLSDDEIRAIVSRGRTSGAGTAFTKKSLFDKKDSATKDAVTSKKGPGDKTTEATPKPEGGNPFKFSEVQEQLFHGTNTEFDSLQVGKDGGIHFGTKAQADMRSLGKGKRVLGAYINVERLERVKDTGGNWKKAIQNAKRQGYDGIVYLNRYEGMTTENVVKHHGKDLDRIPDTAFKKLFPEAEDSYIVFDPKKIKLVPNQSRPSEKGGSAKFRKVTDAVPEAPAETDEQAGKFTEAIENWLATAKIPFISHTRKDIENLGGAREMSLAKRLDHIGIKGVQRKNIISKLVSDITGEKLENVTLDELTPKGKALVHNFLDNVQLDPYGKAIIEEVENHHGVKLTKKFVEGVDDFRDLNKAHIFTLQPYRAADFVDPSGELYKQTVIPAEDANHKIREEFDVLQKKLRELMPGAKKGSRVSAMLQDYAEGRLDLGKIPERWRGHIRETSVWARKIYDENLERVNKARAQAGKSEIKHRDDYFTHGAELSFLMEFFGGAHKIPNEVAKISHLTHPNSPYFKYEFRKGGEFNSDGIGNFLAWNDNALKTIHNTPVLLNARAYIKHLPPNAFRYFTSWSDEVLAGKTSPIDKAIPAPLLKGWTWLRHRMVKNIIIGSARIAVQQPSTFAVTFSELATGRASTLGDVARNIQDAFWAFGHSFTKSGQDFCAKHSREYRDRMYIEDFDPGMLNSLEYKVQFINMKLDQIMVGQAFLGKARQLIRQGMDPEEAYIEADKTAKKTNASYQKINLPPILRANMGKNLLPVQTFTFNFMHYAGMDTLGLKNTRGKKVALAKGLTLMAACMAINELYEGLHMRPTWDFMSLIPGLGYLKYGVSGPLGVIHSMYKYAAGDQSGTSFGKAMEKAAWQIAPPFGGEQIRKSIDGYKTITDPERKPYKIDNDWDRLMAVVFGPGSSMQAIEYWEARNNSPLKKLMDDANKKHSRTQRRSRRTRQDRR